jgi:hypothetical protein
MAGVVLLVGAPGAGKSAALEALATLLEIDGVPHGAIESEELSRGWPLLGADVWTAQLEAVLEHQRAAGRELFLIAATVEDASELDALHAACGARRPLVVCLSAAPAVAGARVAAREPEHWPGRPRLIAHAEALAETVPRLTGVDLVIETSAARPEDIAEAIRAAMRTHGLCP